MVRKNKERIQKIKEIGDSRYIYRNEVDKICFQHMAYGDFIDLPRTITSDKVLRDKTFKIAKNPKHFYASYRLSIKLVNVHRIQCHNHCIHVNFTTPHKQLSNVKSVFQFLDHVSSL